MKPRTKQILMQLQAIGWLAIMGFSLKNGYPLEISVAFFNKCLLFINNTMLLIF